MFYFVRQPHFFTGVQRFGTGDGQNYAPPDPYEKIGFRGMGVTKPYKSIRSH
jgi:hypothetical protein